MGRRASVPFFLATRVPSLRSPELLVVCRCGKVVAKAKRGRAEASSQPHAKANMGKPAARTALPRGLRVAYRGSRREVLGGVRGGLAPPGRGRRLWVWQPRPRTFYLTRSAGLAKLVKSFLFNLVTPHTFTRHYSTAHDSQTTAHAAGRTARGRASSCHMRGGRCRVSLHRTLIDARGLHATAPSKEHRRAAANPSEGQLPHVGCGNAIPIGGTMATACKLHGDGDARGGGGLARGDARGIWLRARR